MLVKKVCPVCEKVFQPERAKQRVCSITCRGIYQRGENHPNYKGGRRISPEGYIKLMGKDYEHRAVAEKALGRPLPKGAVVHHVDENTLNNSPDNLVICPSVGYHAMLHTNKRIIEAGGKIGEHLFCGLCKQLLPLSSFRAHKGRFERYEKSGWCRECCCAKDRERWRTGRRKNK